VTTQINELASILRRHGKAVGEMQPTAVPRLCIFRANQPTTPTPSVYRSIFCLVVSGRKQVFFGSQAAQYGVGDCFLVTVDLPVLGTILQASSDAPYLALCLELDGPTLATIALRASVPASEGQADPLALQADAATEDVADAALRLARLLDQPRDINLLAPVYEQELLSWLFRGPWGSSLHSVSQGSSRMSQIGRAITWLQKHYATTFEAKKLAEAAGGMSVSTLNRHFRAITAMSPLQYQKQLRLQEARRLLASREAGVADAAYAVGYASPSQFIREYRRLFGAPPAQHANTVRA
jgi:AraC-like DNA-binding protein